MILNLIPVKLNSSLRSSTLNIRRIGTKIRKYGNHSSNFTSMNTETTQGNETRVVKVDPESYEERDLKEPAAAIREGGLVGFPTETVYGIGANEADKDAVERLLNVRNSPSDKKLTIHIADLDDFQRFCPSPPPMGSRLADRFWPGPLTLVVPHSERGSVGLRMPDHRIALDLIRLSDVDVVAPSANLSGESPSLDAESVLDVFEGKIDYVVDGGPVQHEIASTVVRVDHENHEILREGAIPSHEILKEQGPQLLFVCTGNTCRSPMAAALAREMLKDKFDLSLGELRENGIRIESAGTNANGGSPPSRNARRVMREEYNLSIREQYSQPVTPSILLQSDHILVMTPRHKQTLTSWLPEVEQRIRVLNEGKGGIPDPVGGDLKQYRTSARKIEEVVREQLDDLF